MSNEDIEHLDFPLPDDGPEKEVDPATLANLDQEQQAFKDARRQFAAMYGFVHDCRCAEDYAEGNTVEVAKCFVNLCNQAMAVLSFSHMENKQLRAYLEQMMVMNNDLATMLKERGFEEDLEKYFTEEIDEEDDPSFGDLQDLDLGEGNSIESARDDDDGDDEELAIN